MESQTVGDPVTPVELTEEDMEFIEARHMSLKSGPGAHPIDRILARLQWAREVLAMVRYKDWLFHLIEDGSFAYLQLTWLAPCSDTGESAIQSSRKWRLSEHMTRSELVQTAFLAVQVAEEHEIRESFQYRGLPVFGPHFDVEVLAMAIEAGRSEDVRPQTPV